ncbi:MAG: glycerol kinase [Sulfobacillus benefaciens]|uniref:Glycerol kinase n=1 Tax=Sulfobacillus benefaciens TaxID=453960 RepID=A0A2T2XKQ8_9FIRM|nr:MAG: glycerol kinase [Sulfobacillus benefaciens]
MYLLVLDQGTTSSRAIIFSPSGDIVSTGQIPIAPRYPEPGWVEQDPEQIWHTAWEAMTFALKSSGLDFKDIAAIGITNQRETTLVWDRKTGVSVAPAIVWQCRRTAPRCQKLVDEGWEPLIRERTGLVLDAYFSATKLEWLLNLPGIRDRAQRGELCFGTVDAWLAYNLTGGRRHVTDVTNASRTLLYNIHRHMWDPDLLKLFNIPPEILPEVVPSSGIIAMTDSRLTETEIPIAAMVGDQTAALFGQGCVYPGMAKNTYGTGAFLLMHTGKTPTPTLPGLLTTVAAEVGQGSSYALEGSIFMAGAAIDWLKEPMGFISRAQDSENVALSLKDSEDVYVVPAFTGLGSPYWDGFARGTVVGLSRSTGPLHIVRATLESIAYQTRDVLELMAVSSGYPFTELRVDGGVTRNRFLMQFQSDILGVPVLRSQMTETTALGAAYLAGLGIGIWKSVDQLPDTRYAVDVFEPHMTRTVADQKYQRWQDAVSRSRHWAQP